MDSDIFRKMPPTLSCCFCSTSKTGARIIATLQVIGGALGVVVGTIGLLDEYYYPRGTYLLTMKMVYFGLYGILMIVASIFMLRGVNQEKPSLIRIWLITQVVLTVVSFVVWMVIIGLTNYYLQFEQDMQITFLLIFEGVQIYFIVVVSSYYSKTLGEVEVGSQLDDRVANI